MPIPTGYVPAIQHNEAYPTDFRTGLAASTTDLGGGNTQSGKVALDVNIAASGGGTGALVGVKGADGSTIAATTNTFPTALYDDSGHRLNIESWGSADVILKDSNSHTLNVARDGDNYTQASDGLLPIAGVDGLGAGSKFHAFRALNSTPASNEYGLPTRVIGPTEVNDGASATVTGSTPYSNTALSNTKQEVKASSGRLYGYHLYNPNVVSIFVQFFDLASGSVTVGSTTPTFVLTIPANATSPATLDTQLAVPINFSNAITIAATTTATGSTAPTTALNCSLFYA